MAVADRTTLRDLGNGLIILGSILLVIYIALLLLSFLVYAEEGWKVWTYPSMAGPVTVLVVLLLVAGTIMRYLPSSASEAEDVDIGEE
jgi:uncharacterized membrane protein YkgB